MKILLTFLLATSAGFLIAQPSVHDLERYMEYLRRSPYAPLPESVLKDIRNEGRIIGVLQPYFTDTLEAVRTRAYYILKRIGRKSHDPAVRQHVVHLLVIGIKDKSSGISGVTSEALTGFSRSDFSPVDKDSIGSYLTPGTYHLDRVLKLAGYLDLRDQILAINTILNSKTSFQNRWAARLALARMGDNAAIASILSKLRNAPVNDDLIYEIVPDLVYTRQKEIFKFFEKVVNSDTADCQAADPDSNEKILCGYRLMEYMAPVIEDFPITVDDFGNLNTDDYPRALATVRAWLAQNSQYVIRTDSF